MTKITFAIFTALGLMLASVLFPAVDAFACTCTTSCSTLSCTCTTSGTTGTYNSLPTTLSNGTKNTLPYTDPNAVLQHTLPASISVAGGTTTLYYSGSCSCTNPAGCAGGTQTCSGGSCGACSGGPSKDGCGYCGGSTSCSGSCTNGSGCSNGTSVCSGDSCVCSGGSGKDACGYCGGGVGSCGGSCTNGSGCSNGTYACSGDSCVCTGGSGKDVCGTCGGSVGSNVCTATGCGTTSGTWTCGGSCTATMVPCSCTSLPWTYNVAYAYPNYTNNGSRSFCLPGSAVMTGVSSPASGCGNPGTPSTLCSPTFSLSCSSSCAVCTCIADCSPCSMTPFTGNCGQYCPATCDTYCIDASTCYYAGS